ncbi:helicase UvrD, partial [Candidatus Magnetomorum sp. HK-1]
MMPTDICGHSKFPSKLEHHKSWIMFTPTELLKQYLKEAFNREEVPASEERIKTWSDYRRYLARDVFNILKSSTGGQLILNDSKAIIHKCSLEQLIDWYKNYKSFFNNQILNQLKLSSTWLKNNVDEKNIIKLSKDLDNLLNKDNCDEINIYILISIDKLKDRVSRTLIKFQEQTTSIIKKSLNYLLNTNENFLNELQKFIKELKNDPHSLQESLSEKDKDEVEENDDELSESDLTRDYNTAVRSLARAKFTKRKLDPNSKSSKIIHWLKDRVLSEEKLMKLGKNLIIQSHLRKFLNPLKLYIDNASSLYLLYRKEKVKNNSPWYTNDIKMQNDVNSVELDMIILLSLQNIKSLIQFFSENEISRRFPLADLIFSEYRNQVLVDEITDFSPIQLACMKALTNPKINSFVGCGDFNQRITPWGTRTIEEMNWILPKVEIKSINIQFSRKRIWGSQFNDTVA